MTWFRVGGAGIPATLKNAMNAVFNKKFGTSGQNYPPKQWPDDVNLLGPLPEGTASGPIANFSDGADGVPLKNCEVALPASLDGYSSVNVVATGSNLWDEEWEEGLISASDGQNTPSDQYSRTKNYITVKPSISVYLFLGVTPLYIRRYGKDKEYLGYAQINTSSVWNIPSDTYFIRFCWDGTTYTNNISVNFPSTETTYNPENNPNTHTVSLDRTILGGTADIITGQGESLCGKIVFDGSETRWSAYTTGNGYAIPLTGMKRGTWYTSPLALSYPLPKAPNNDNLGVRIGVNNDGIYVVQANTLPGVTDLTSFKAYLSENPLTVIYPLDDSETFAFDPISINSKLGNNAIYNAGGGDTTLVYRRDIDLALQAVSSSRGLMMASRPVTQLIGEESNPDQLNELVENDETEQEGEDNAR